MFFLIKQDIPVAQLMNVLEKVKFIPFFLFLFQIQAITSPEKN
jgi:hypothetical protein